MRPAASTLLALCLLSSGCSCTRGMMAPAANPDGVVIRVTTSYPGANAHVVAETIAPPIEQQVNGVEGMTLLESESRNDGTYTLTVHLASTTNPDVALVLVQNCVSIAEPLLPMDCQRQGVIVRKMPNAQPTFWIAVTSQTRTEAELTEIAKGTISKSLVDSEGVAEVRVVGGCDRQVMLSVDPAKLTARGLKLEEVERALKAKKVSFTRGLVLEGKLVPYSLPDGAQLPDPKKLGEIVVVTRKGEDILLRDVGKIRDVTIPRGFASANGRSAPLVAVTAWPGKLTAADVRKTLEGIKGLPEGVKVELVADTSAGGMAVVNIRLPGSASRERTQEVVSRAGKLLGEQAAVKEWVAFNEEWEPNAATMLLKLPQGNATAVADARKAVEDIKEAICVVSEMSAKQRPFPVRLAVCHTGEMVDHGELSKTATALADRMKATNIATDVTALPGPPEPELFINLDREKMEAVGVSTEDVTVVIHAAGGTAMANDFTLRFPAIRIAPSPVFKADDWKKLEVRGANDKRVPLGTLLSFTETRGLRQIVRINLYPAVVLSANPPAGTSVSDAAAKSLKLAETELPKGFKAEALLPAPRS